MTVIIALARGSSLLNAAFRICGRVSGPVNSLPLRPADEVPLDSASGTACPYTSV